MEKTVKLALSSLLAIVLMSGMALALDRELLYSEKPSGRLQGIASKIQNVREPEIPYSDLPAETEYFVRITPRIHILTKNNGVKDDAILGTKPFVFFTIPQGIYGKSLLDVYLDIGYEAEDIIRRQRDKDMVAIVFRYPENIRYSNVKNGQLPEKWDKKVYSTTWDNMFSLFSRLAEKAVIIPKIKGEFAPEKIFFRSNTLKSFVSGFPESGKQRIKTTSYAALKATGGTDWTYRDLLEKKLSLFEHFRGNGFTLNEIKDPEGVKDKSGMPEFAGPDMKVRNLPEVIIIHLGKLKMEDTYSEAARGTAEKQKFTDPFKYCAAAGTINKPDERYIGSVMPESLVQGIIKAGMVSAYAPPEFVKNAAWRCMDGKVKACHFGANIPCMEKADSSKTPAPKMKEFCKTNPGADIIPVYVTGRTTVYKWHCKNSEPEIVRTVLKPDAQGFISDFWTEISK
ncbi:MAG: hypothetical protein GY795_47660 [Desulfobacterales bacterium]|nr:hypothetical protein [Desulfobacterales bacterium]